MLLPSAQPEEIGIDSKRLARAYDLLTEYTTGKQPAMPGAALAVGRNGKLVPPRFFGKHGPAADAEPLRKDALFLLASITKPITYLGAMILVERGLLNLSDHVTRYIPDFAAHHKEETLVQHLFTHTSGLPDMLDNNLELRRAHAPLSKFIEGAIRDTVPRFAPGTQLSYQSMGTLVVAEIVQRISGHTIAEFLKKEIFDPLGLKSTSLGAAGLPRERIARIDVPAEQADADWNWNGEYWRVLGVPWGGLLSSPEEFAVLCQLMLSGGKLGDVRILAPRTVRQMTTNRLDDHPDLPESVRRTEPWGLGWRMNHTGLPESWSDLLDRSVYGHTGSTGTQCWIDPASGGFCCLFTTAPYGNHPWRMKHVSSAVAAAFE